MKIDLNNFSDKELLELQKQIDKEKKERKEKGELLFKGDLRFNNDDYLLFHNRINALLKEKLDKPFKEDEICNYVSKIPSSILEICDFVFGNFKADITNRNNLRITRSTSRLTIDNKTKYNQLYLAILDTIEKSIKEENNN